MTHFGAAGNPSSPELNVPTEEQAVTASARFAMLADPTRLKILWLISDDERDVTTIARLACTSPTIASQHLAKLRLAGLVTVRADGKRRLYEVKGTHIRNLIREALYAADHQISGIVDH